MPKPATPQHIVDQVPALHARGLSDRKIAAELGIAKPTVQRIRARLGLPANTGGYKPTEAELADLRILSNKAMARKYGFEDQLWGRARKAHGIAPFRLPTTVNRKPHSPKTGKPIVKVPKPVAANTVRNPLGQFEFRPATIAQVAPQRPAGRAYDAAAFLQAERYPVWNREKLGVGKGWQVGRNVMSEADMIAKAERIKAMKMERAA